MTLLDTGTWHGMLYSDGWMEAAGGTAAVRSPATREDRYL
jgi:benzaldehyde dehydrogenase (NAD)